MRRKILQDYANTLCQMFVSWRMAEDVKKLSRLPDGKLSLDVLAGTAHHDLVGAVELWIASELQAWFLERLAISNIPAEYIEVATVDVQLKSQHRHTPKAAIVTFDFIANSTIQTDETSYHGMLQEQHAWHFHPRD
ncbi:hypothetical protein ACYFX5_11160 [Bremerella sp. T1]|uniref:hypothetical protein n=1 Tax=Bremerella sp. TYQ1 TaxID=3119568 RepID=UPI001CCC2D29|nr:hypothetical protein [Bremerella volcania]UBM38806.1 hypothetical protein LA756_13105 [Bremerella volcania]